MRAVFSYKKFKAIEDEMMANPLTKMLLGVINNDPLQSVDYSLLDGQEVFATSKGKYKMLDGYVVPEDWCDIYPDEEPTDYTKKTYKLDGQLILDWHKKRYADIMEKEHLDVNDIVKMDTIIALDGQVVIYDPKEYNFYAINDNKRTNVRFAWLREVK